MDNFDLHWLLLVIFIILFLVFFIICIFAKNRNKDRLLPPGPFSLPIIGTIYKHGMKLSPETLTEMSKKYGNIFKLCMGPQKFIILNNYDSIQLAMRRPYDFAHRGNEGKYTWMQLNPYMCGIVARNYDEQFLSNRAAAMTILRQLGVGRSTMQDKIVTEAQCIVDIIRSTQGQPFSPSTMIETSVANVILHILINKRYSHQDTKLEFIQKETHRFLDNVLWTFVIDSMPNLRHIQPFKNGYNNVTASYNNILTFMWGHALELIDNYQPGHSSSFVELYAEKYFPIGTSNAKESLELRYMLQDFLVTGLETTSTLLQWIIVYMANRPEMQQKLGAEISSVVGKDRPVVLADREQLPYLEVVILETLRYSNLTPLMMHMSNLTTDVQLGGYTIPKRSMVMLNYHSVNTRTDVWTDPHIFRPERYFTQTGQISREHHSFPFGAGSRTCTGELLAKQELFLFTATLFQTFEFLLAEGVGSIDEEPIREFTWRPKPFCVRAVPKDSK